MDTGTTGGGCTECGEPLFWMGMSWAQHSQERHDGTRRRLLGAVARLLDQEVRNGFLVDQAASQDLVGIRMRSGVYPGLIMWNTITRESWDELGEPGGPARERFLRDLRESATDCARWKYGVVVNQATWSHKIYDDR